MFLDKIESATHAAYAALVHYIANARQRLLEEKAVALAFIAKERREILAALAHDEAVMLEEFHELEAKAAKAEAARARVVELLTRL